MFLEKLSPFSTRFLGNFSVDCTFHTVSLKVQTIFLSIRSVHLVQFVFEPRFAHEPSGNSHK